MAQEEKSIAQELSDAFDGATDDAAAPAAEPAGGDASAAAPEAAAASPDAGKPQGDGDGRVRGPDGRFVPKSADAPAAAPAKAEPGAQPAAPAAPEGAQPAVAEDAPPSTWTGAAKAEWGKLSPIIKAEFKKRESDYQRGITQYKTAADFGTRIDQVMRPYAGIIREKGGNPEGVISNLLATAYKLQTGTPQERGQLLIQAAQQYGADLTPWMQARPAGEAQPGAVDQNALAPLVQQLLQPHLQRIDQISSRFTTAEQRREQEATQGLVSQIEQFRSAVDAQGQPKHVHFDDVRTIMASLIEDYAERGEALPMEQAYEMACRAHPEVSRIASAEQRQREEAQRLAEQKRLAEDARRATTAQASGQGSVGVVDTSKVSLRDELGARLEGRIA
jgi:hypothetical protein